MTHVRLEPQVGVRSSRCENLGVAARKEGVLLPVHDEEWRWRDTPDNLDRRLRDLIPQLPQPSTRRDAGRHVPDPSFGRPVDEPHWTGSPLEPVAGRADAHDGVRISTQSRVTKRDRAAHRPANHRQRPNPVIAKERRAGGQIMHLGMSECGASL